MSESRHSQNTTSEALAKRIFKIMPPNIFMTEIFSVMKIEANRNIPTAAINGNHNPRLLINPDFVDQYCQRDEHLMLLVMHEIWHVLLAHLRLYPRITQAQNIACDAIINAMLSRQFHTPEFMGFLDVLNPADHFPSLLLRPPLGWPHKPMYPDLPLAGGQRILRQLYPPNNQYQPLPLYDEILHLIQQAMNQQKDTDDTHEPDLENKGGDSPSDGPTNDSSSTPPDTALNEPETPTPPVLLGNHDALEPAGDSKLVDDMLRAAINNMLDGDFIDSGVGDTLRELVFDPQMASQRVCRVFARVLSRCLTQDKTGPLTRQRSSNLEPVGTGFIPNPKDRSIHARRQLQIPTMLWSRQPVQIRSQTEQKGRALVYVDVSGSMSNFIPLLQGLLMRHVIRKEILLYQFSTLVKPLTPSDMHAHRIQTSGGTDINCVLQHILTEMPPIFSQVLILTDGATRSLNQELIQQIHTRHVRTHFVLPAKSYQTQIIEPVATSITILPSTAYMPTKQSPNKNQNPFA